MTGFTAVLLFAAWMLVLTFLYVGRRVALVLGMKKAANAWTRGEPNDDPAFFVRAQNAHLNTVETFPIFAAIVIIAALMQKSPVVDGLACWVLAARIAQSTVHLISTAPLMVFLRANFFIVQIGLMGWMIWGLLK